MSKSNDITGDRITNALKGDKEKYRDGWEAIFGRSSERTGWNKDMKMLSKESLKPMFGCSEVGGESFLEMSKEHREAVKKMFEQGEVGEDGGFRFTDKRSEAND